MRFTVYILAFLFILDAFPALADLRIATWNIYWLGSQKNARTESDYALLRDYADALAADVIILQEVEDASYIGKVFPPSLYHIEVSGRPAVQRVAIAIRKGVSYRRLEDVTSLDVGSVRRGVVVEVDDGGETIRILGVHLKSGCFADDLDDPQGKACKKLARQIEPLETWIDGETAAGRPVIVAGDFNRRLDMADDDLWREINDGEPAPLIRAGAGEKPRCWGGKFGEFIDHLVLNPRAAGMMKSGSFAELTYGARPYTKWRKRLSDHCPVSIDLKG